MATDKPKIEEAFLNIDLAEVQALALSYRNYHHWPGPKNIRDYEMRRAKRTIQLTGLWYQVARRRYYLNKIITGNWNIKN